MCHQKITPHFHELTNEIFNLTNNFEEVNAGKLGLEAYIRGLVQAKVDNPDDGLISRYVEQYLTTGELTVYGVHELPVTW